MTITIKEAIEVGQSLQRRLPGLIFEDDRAAIQLLIETGKRIKTWRKNREGNPDMLLPGETKE